MKYLYMNFNNGVIDSYRYIKNNAVNPNIINASDMNTLFKGSYTLFDYILPGIPK